MELHHRITSNHTDETVRQLNYLLGRNRRTISIEDEQLEAGKFEINQECTENTNIEINSKRCDRNKADFFEDKHESPESSYNLSAASSPEDDLYTKAHIKMMTNTLSLPWSTPEQCYYKEDRQVQRSNKTKDNKSDSHTNSIAIERSHTKLNENDLARRMTDNGSSYACNQSKEILPVCYREDADVEEKRSRQKKKTKNDLESRITLMSAPRKLCKEKLCDPTYKVKVSIVKPLTSGDENTSPTEQNTASKNIDIKSCLDWDKVFIFIAENLPPTNYKLFFLILFGESQSYLPKGMDIDTTISHIECDAKSKSMGTSDLFFELLKKWKQILGTKCDTQLIENALSERKNNCLLESFRDFMREPPLLQLMPKETKAPCEYTDKRLEQTRYLNAPMPQETHVFALHDTVQSQVCISGRSNFNLQTHEENRIALVCHNKRNQLMIEDTTGTSAQCAHNVSESMHGTCNQSGKRQWSDTFPSQSESEGKQCKYKRTDEYSPFSFRSSNGKGEPMYEHYKQTKSFVPWKVVDENFTINLIKKYLPFGCQMLTADEYNLFMYHTISIIMQKTCETEGVVTSIQMVDFADVKEMKTRRGHVSFSIDTEKALLTLGEAEWDFLRLYTTHARESVMQRLKLKERAFLFIAFDGHALFEQNSVKEATNLKEDVSISITDTAEDNSAKTDQTKACLNSDRTEN